MHTQNYEPTELGAEIAKDSGLDEYAARLHKEDAFDPVIYFLTTDDVSTYLSDKVEEQARLDEIIHRSFAQSSDDDRRIMLRGLQIQPGIDTWRHNDGIAAGTLFPTIATRNFHAAMPEDRLVISGVAGMQLASSANTNQIFTNQNYEKYGFRSHAEACAFAGAFVVSKIIAIDRTRIFGQNPKFSFETQGALSHTIRVGGTFHGDFVITKDTIIKNNAIAPTGMPIEISPVNSDSVAGYHSVEPDITTAMLVNEFLSGGKSAALALLKEFKFALEEFNTTAEDSKPGVALFGDYGDGDVRYALVPLRVLVQYEDEKDRQKEGNTLYTAPYLPQSDILFEIVRHNDGLRFQNRESGMPPPMNVIDIPRSNFRNLFISLLSQAQAGSGRTAPQQHLALCNEAWQLLAEKI